MSSTPKPFWDDWGWPTVIRQILLIACAHFFLTALVIPIFFIEFMIDGKSASLLVTKTWVWVFATPVRILDVSGTGNSISDHQLLLLFIPNSLLYGVFWWFCYRMYWLMFPPTEKEPT